MQNTLLTIKRYTLDEFEAFINLPEHEGRRFEYISGEIVEVSSKQIASFIAAKILILIGLYLHENDIGFLTGADGGYKIAGERYIPDVAYMSYTRQAEVSNEGYNSIPPELVVEVISDLDNKRERASLRRKVVNYLREGIIIWVVDPQDRLVEVYEPDQPVKIFDEHDTITAQNLLPDFVLKITDIFPPQTEEDSDEANI